MVKGVFDADHVVRGTRYAGSTINKSYSMRDLCSRFGEYLKHSHNINPLAVHSINVRRHVTELVYGDRSQPWSDR